MHTSDGAIKDLYEWTTGRDLLLNNLIKADGFL